MTDAREGLKGPEISSAGPFKQGKPPRQCYRCMGWGHYARNCASKVAAKGSRQWKTLKGRRHRRVGSSPTSTGTPQISKVTSLGGTQGIISGPQYHNPDPLVRLIGPPNEAPVVVEGLPITGLIDSGANMSAITRSFAKELQLKVHKLNKLLDIEGRGGAEVPYHGYVELRLKIPQ